MTEWYEDAIGTTVEHANMPGPVFHLEPVGQLANQMIEYMVALKFADMVRDCRISNITIPAWGISHPPIESPGPVATERREQRINLPAFADLVWSEQIGRVEWCGYGQRMENFLPPSRYQSVFVSPFSMPMGYGPDYLVCPVRAADILDGPAPDYALTPVEFYLDIVKQTGLTPVFIGQTHPNRYMDRISAAFPNAIFREPQDNVLIDFETIRQSKNLVIGVSTYSWLAAWLSQADNIYLTVSGLYNPMQKTDVDLLPFGDPRYKFFLFPINYGVPLSRHADVHRRIAPYWRQMPHEALRQQFDAAPRFARDLKQTLSLFDPEYYLATNGDVAAVAQHMGPGFARDHYIHHGFAERRLPFRLDRGWYAAQYPLAAFEVAQGDYAEFAHHYMAIGKARGYRPYPPETDPAFRP
jgi:hypothetical protein